MKKASYLFSATAFIQHIIIACAFFFNPSKMSDTTIRCTGVLILVYAIGIAVDFYIKYQEEKYEH